jgi:hypothetical protein
MTGSLSRLPFDELRAGKAAPTKKGGFLEILRFFVGIGQVNYHFSFVIRLRHHCVVIYCNCGIFPNHTLNNS